LFELDVAMEMAGEDFELNRNEIKVAEIKGIRNTDKSSKRKYIGFYPGTDIQPGDWLTGKKSGDELCVIDRETDVIYGKPYQVKAFYKTKVEYERDKQSQPPTFSIENVTGSIIGNQQYASINIVNDLQEVRKLIETHGKEDKE